MLRRTAQGDGSPLKLDAERIQQAYERARADLLAQREPSGHWVGELSSSSLSTATAISALGLVERGQSSQSNGQPVDASRDVLCDKLIVGGLRWLAERQNPDGGWGDTDKSLSNIATTMLVEAAFHLNGVPAKHADVLDRAQAYIKSQGSLRALRRRYGKDKTFAVPILTNCALAGLVPWSEVDALPFELACLPHSTFAFLRMPVVSYALPALIAIGQVRYHHGKPINPFTRVLRQAALGKSLAVLERMQPDSGGFLEATPLTSFVVMSLAGCGHTNHPVVRRGVDFLIRSVRTDGSWPIDTDLATWTTTLALNALTQDDDEVPHPDCRDWLLSCQHLRVHPFTNAQPGGWGWSDKSGAVPDADDTPSALLALATWPDAFENQNVLGAAKASVRWLLDLQNRDGGWPTFCRGWGTMPFDRSSCDLTAHALRALDVWRKPLTATATAGEERTALDARINRATSAGFQYLARSQRPDGSWVPLWFGNQHHPAEENPIYGTSRVLLAYRDSQQLQSATAWRGLNYLARNQNPDGGWGGGPTENYGGEIRSSVEETALALEAILPACDDERLQTAASEGLDWLVSAVEENRHRDCSPIGFYFAKLWYYERLYPLIFTVSTLGHARRKWCAPAEPATATARPDNA